MDDLQVLKRARAALLEYGWHQGGMGHPSWSWDVPGPMCSVGAIRFATNGISPYDWAQPTERHISLLLESHGAYRGLANWNDAVSRTFEDVIRLFDRAIQGIEQAQGATIPEALPAPAGSPVAA